MSRYPTTNDFHSIVVENTPLIDVRAPVEFEAGAFPKAFNLPIMDDTDRHLVGICYKKSGKEAAFELAFKRVSGSIKENRVSAWVENHSANPDALLYCFRGGMRSKTAQQWITERTGAIVPRLQGGYKAFRRYLIDSLDPTRMNATPVILGGRTGTGKTILLGNLANSVDLENIANHRGSTFGGHISPQPSQIDFENRLAYALIQHRHRQHRYLVLEDEGSYIGARYIPHELAAFFKRDTMVLLECEVAERVAITHKEYVIDAQREFCDAHGLEEGVALWLEFMKSRIQRIRKRLGGLRLKKVLQLIDEAHAQQMSTGDTGSHRKWVELLLKEYYDPMYDYQIEKSGRHIAFRGGFNEVLTYLASLESNARNE